MCAERKIVGASDQMHERQRKRDGKRKTGRGLSEEGDGRTTAHAPNP
jgi:hypothetical protein